MISHSTRQSVEVPMQNEPVMIAAISQICFLRRATILSLSSSTVSVAVGITQIQRVFVSGC